MSDHHTNDNETWGCLGVLFIVSALFIGGMLTNSCSHGKSHRKELDRLKSTVRSLERQDHDYTKLVRENDGLKSDLRTLSTALSRIDRTLSASGSSASRTINFRHTGEKGPRGDKGPQGDPGGPRGPRGFTGPRGAQGKQGLRGATGPQGPKGDAGGPMGPQGPAGLDGADGKDGVPGPRGLKGDRGLQGAPGPQGPRGVPGKPGMHGTDGTLPIWELCLSISLCLIGLYVAKALTDFATDKYRARHGNIQFHFKKGTAR